MVRNVVRNAVVLAVLAGLLISCGRKKYENPITKDTQQPDKVLFDKAINDIEHSRYEIARLTLQTLINTYDTSEYLAKAKLAIADSWYREGGAHALAQAEAEYKDFILFYPTMEEAAQAQERVCDIHFRQMEKADRDTTQALRAEDECRQLVVQFPNSRFAPEAQQKLRDIQEVLGDAEYRVGVEYHNKGSYPAAANRFLGLTNQFPLFSRADDALWQLGDSYEHMGDRFENQAADAYTRIVREYPLSEHAQEAADKLKAMNRPVPEADPVAYAHMKYELENHVKPGLMSHFWGIFRSSPDMSMAAKSGSPTMTPMQPTIPVSVPRVAPNPEGVTGVTAAGGGVGSDVTATTVKDTTTLDQNPDARANPPGASGAASNGAAANGTNGAAATGQSTPAAQNYPLPSNHTLPPKKQKKPKKPKKTKDAPQVQPQQPASQSSGSAPGGASSTQ
ncbi:MAG TPA: outer membrane protein assembly factor BamD [Bryobacteraceae bacterium]|nr:outer membrane protein assembly factor BamD [Bryobacteraceae bacterium]